MTKAIQNSCVPGLFRVPAKKSPTPCVSSPASWPVRLYQQYYAAHFMDHTAPFPGVPRALRRMKDLGVKLAVVSNKPHGSVMALTEMYFEGMFDSVSGFGPHAKPKPDPEQLNELSLRFGAEKSRCAYVGDALVDIETAVNAGFCPIGVLWGFGGGEVAQTGAMLVENAEQLLNLTLA